MKLRTVFRAASTVSRGATAGARDLAGQDAVESRIERTKRHARTWGALLLAALYAAGVVAAAAWALSGATDGTAGYLAFGALVLAVAASHRRRVVRHGTWDAGQLVRGAIAHVTSTRGAATWAAWVLVAFVAPYVTASVMPELVTVVLLAAGPLGCAVLLRGALRRAQCPIDRAGRERRTAAQVLAAVVYVNSERAASIEERLTYEERPVERLRPDGKAETRTEPCFTFAAHDSELVQLAADPTKTRDRLATVAGGEWDFAREADELILRRADEWTHESRALLTSSKGLVSGLRTAGGTPLVRADQPTATGTVPGALTRLTESETIQLVLSSGMSPAQADRLVAWAHVELDADIVEFLPHEDRAGVVRLTEEARRLRDGYSALLRTDPHHVRVGVEYSDAGERTITVESAALRRHTHESREELAVELRRATPGAEAHWGASSDPVSGVVTIVEREDTLGKVALYPADVSPTLKRVPFAVREDGSIQSLALLESNALLGGIPGGGKSGGLTALLRGISQLEHVALIGLDPKRVEMSMWTPRFSVVATVSDVDPDDDETDEFEHASAVLSALVAEMQRRYQWLQTNGLKKVSEREIGPERPLLVVVVDELADLIAQGGSRAQKVFEEHRRTMLRRLVALGRAAGVVVIGATQKPTADVVPTSFRDLIAQRVAYKTTTPSMSDVILGHGMSQLGGLSHEISADQRGVAYVLAETSSVPERTRTLWIPDDEVAGIAEASAHLRVELPWMPTASSASSPKFGRVIEESVPKNEEVIDLPDLPELDFSAEFGPVETAPEPDPFAAAAARTQMGGEFDDLIAD